MECRHEWSELQNFLIKEYGVINMTLTIDACSEGVAEIAIRQGGLVKLMNDLILLKASKELTNERASEQEEEIKCTFDEAMQFNS